MADIEKREPILQKHDESGIDVEFELTAPTPLGDIPLEWIKDKTEGEINPENPNIIDYPMIGGAIITRKYFSQNGQTRVEALYRSRINGEYHSDLLSRTVAIPTEEKGVLTLVAPTYVSGGIDYSCTYFEISRRAFIRQTCDSQDVSPEILSASKIAAKL